MKRVLILFVFVNILSAYNVVLANQQSPVYASQAGTMPNNYNNQNQGNGNYNNGYNNNNNQSYNNGQYYNNQQNNNYQYNNQYNNNNNQYSNNNQQNNNGYNWQTQYANQYGVNNNPNIANVSYNNQNGYYNNQQNNNQNSNKNNNKRNKQNIANNPFLNNYARRNRRFSASIYKMDRNGTLYKTQLDSKSLQKAIVIFFGDWCPHCANFLNSLSRYLNQLISSGIKIIFISVPSIERIQNWQTPSIADYNEAQQKLRSFNIIPEQLNQYAQTEYDNAKQQKKNKQQYNHDILYINMPAVELVLLGDNSVLDNNAIDSLPTMLAINNGTEQFRGGSDNSLDVVNFENSVTMQQFNEIWYEEDDEEEEEDEDDAEDYEEEDEEPKRQVKKKKKSTGKKSSSSNKKKKTNTNKKSPSKKTASSKPSKVDKPLADFHTKMLNKGCQCSCNNSAPVLVKRKSSTVKKNTPVVIQNTVVDEQFIEEDEEKEVQVNNSRGKCIMQHRPVMCESKRKQMKQKVRNRIETAIEKHESNRCNCH